MYKRIITLGIFILISFFVFAVYEPPELSAASAAVGTIAYVKPNDTTGDEIWLIEPDRSHDRRIYSTSIADPYSVRGISSLAWRPDAGELVLASNHENDCSWYASDLYSIFTDGSGYRRITNAPACAALANYPKGIVVIAVPGTDGFSQVYIQGAPSVKSIPPGGGVITFNNVADLGNIVQPIVIISNGYRFMTNVFVDVKAGQTVYAEVTSITTGGDDTLGAYGPAWRRDGSRIGYSFGCAELYGIADQPPAGNTGQPLFNASQVTPCAMAWGPTANTANQIVYYNNTGGQGIYRTTEGSSNAGTQLVANDYDAVNFVFRIQYLPDASGFIYSIVDNFGDSSNLYRYDFASDSLMELTSYTNQYARDFAISPDGQTIVFELASFSFDCLWGCGSDLWTMTINGSNPQLFKAGAAHPSWSINAISVPPPNPTPGPVPGSLKVYLPFIKR